MPGRAVRDACVDTTVYVCGESQTRTLTQSQKGVKCGVNSVSHSCAGLYSYETRSHTYTRHATSPAPGLGSDVSLSTTY